jgi:hypothetical protein
MVNNASRQNRFLMPNNNKTHLGNHPKDKQHLIQAYHIRFALLNRYATGQYSR